MTDAMTIEVNPGREVGFATLAASAWAELALQRSELLSVTALLGAWALLVVAGLGTARLRTGHGPAVRRVVATAVMGLGLLVCAWGGASIGAEDLSARLGLVVVLAIAANAMVQDTIRDLYVGLALTCATLVLAAGLAAGPNVALPLVIGVGLVVGCLGLLGAARLAGGLPTLGPTEGSRRAPYGLGKSVLVAVVVGLLAFLLVPHPPGLHTQGRLAAAVRNAVGSHEPAFSGSGTAIPRTPGGYVGRLDLRMRGALPTTPVATVPFDAPQLWRDQVFATYDASGWTNPSDNLGLQSTSGPGTYDLPAEAGTVPSLHQRTDTVRAAPGTGQGVFPVLSPGQPTSIRAAVRPMRVAEGSYVFIRFADGGTYDVTSFGYDALVPRAGIAAGPDPGDLPNRQWTQLPSSLPIRVVELGKSLAAGASDRNAVVARVEDYLRSHEKYRLAAPVPADGQDPVDAFLFGSHEGFCEQFASAETVLLRAAGIPARVATGYAYGRPDGAGRRLFIGSDAHAWVEVYSPGVGWTASDPTAGATLSVDHPSAAQRLLVRARHALDSASGRALIALLLILVVGLAVLVVRLAQRLAGRRRVALHPAEQVSRLLAALGHLEAALAADGRPRDPGETLRELGLRLAAQDPLSRPAAAASEALAVLAQATYAPVVPGPPQRALAAASLETYAEALQAQVRQKMKGHQGSRSATRARDADSIAPGVSSRTRPASARTDSRIPPR
jgi:protein-glutamine gamma-glutamyltransferase